tara:strand:- start:374278 stop:375156 length:879 start_codon:yes stop_codon:yes gene_type:complete
MPIDIKRPAFAGYDRAGVPLLVCAGCSDALEELSTPVYHYGKFDLSVEEHQSLWRYMDFSKFVAMLTQGGLYFTRAANFTDPFEAAAGIASREIIWNEHYLRFFKDAIVTPPLGYPPVKKLDSEIEEDAARLLQQLKFAYALARNSLVSCWHTNDVESEAQWQIYCSSGAPGLAIRTNIDRLWRATKNETGVKIGKIQYMDFKRHFASGDERIFCKRSSLAHEREVRAVLPNDRKAPADGRLVTCNLNDLIEEVIVSPYSPPWFRNVVQETIDKFGYKLCVGKSEISETPFY